MIEVRCPVEESPVQPPMMDTLSSVEVVAQEEILKISQTLAV